jgi:hypothetical protein
VNSIRSPFGGLLNGGSVFASSVFTPVVAVVVTRRAFGGEGTLPSVANANWPPIAE